MAGSPHESLVREAYDAMNRRDVESVQRICADDLVWDVREVAPDEQVYHGPEGVAAYLNHLWEVAAGTRVEVEDVRSVDGETLALVTLLVQGRESGLEIAARYRATWRFRDDRVVYFKAVPE